MTTCALPPIDKVKRRYYRLFTFLLDRYDRPNIPSWQEMSWRCDRLEARGKRELARAKEISR